MSPYAQDLQPFDIMLSQGEQNLVVRASQQDIAEPTDAPILITEKQNLSKTLLLEIRRSPLPEFCKESEHQCVVLRRALATSSQWTPRIASAESPDST
ncbi:hypothetical protein Q8A67_004498 [Cirrhinus molitorella]|uniref:Uncharacterized protein n=1 Tax=Cirrhinus molitorella TaxID=172907 RepID=A0AA88PY85_9TELE|nr:hypothetical protein Q8A67_004498 [Cirrhinus molitorella]